jgi:hypothetical protein
MVMRMGALLPLQTSLMNGWSCSTFCYHSLKVLVLKRWLSSTYNGLFPHLTATYPEWFPADQATLELWTWAALHVWGRAFDVDAQDLANPERRTWGTCPRFFLK